MTTTKHREGSTVHVFSINGPATIAKAQHGAASSRYLIHYQENGQDQRAWVDDHEIEGPAKGWERKKPWVPEVKAELASEDSLPPNDRMGAYNEARAAMKESVKSDEEILAELEAEAEAAKGAK